MPYSGPEDEVEQHLSLVFESHMEVDRRQVIELVADTEQTFTAEASNNDENQWRMSSGMMRTSRRAYCMTSSL